MLPGGRTVLFTLAKGSGEDRWDKAQIVAQSLVDGTRRVLIEGGSDARYVPTGHLVYTLGGTMFAVPFDAESLMVTGTPVPVIVGVRRATGLATGRRNWQSRRTGTLAYLPGPASLVDDAQPSDRGRQQRACRTQDSAWSVRRIRAPHPTARRSPLGGTTDRSRTSGPTTSRDERDSPSDVRRKQSLSRVVQRQPARDLSVRA